MQPLTLAKEFVIRYKQLRQDGKTHKSAMVIIRYEFKNHIDGYAPQAPTLLFSDRSGCDFIPPENEWQIFGDY